MTPALILGLLLATSAPAGPVGRTAGATFSDCAAPSCPLMVVVPAGTAEIGATVTEGVANGLTPAAAAHDGPRHAVAFARPFAVSRDEIGTAAWAAFVKDSGRPDPAACVAHDTASDRWMPHPGYSWHATGFPQTGDSPAVCISWNDAQAYVGWLSKRTGQRYRLLSESEWEYAARGGTATARYWGDAVAPACEHANIMTAATFAALGSPPSWKDKLVCTSPHSFTMAAGQFDANPFGLRDMYGNALEWVGDCYHKDYTGAPGDGAAWQQQDCPARMMRGGAFDAKPTAARSAARGSPLPADFRAIVSGLRVARELD